MKKDLASFYQENYKKWYEREQRKKQAKKRAFFQKPYPCDRDIYGRKRGDER